MSGKHYCAFWYPSLFHQTGINVVDRKYELDALDISDRVRQSSFRLYLNIKESVNGDLTFTTYTLSAGGDKRIEKNKLKLKLEAQSKNGFVVYSFENDSIDFDNYVYSSTFYHHAKSLRHCHDINHESDSGLYAVSDAKENFIPDDIFKQDNVILRNYLKQYESLFTKHYVRIIFELSNFYDKVNLVFDLINRYLKTTDISGLSKGHLQKLEDAVGEIILGIKWINTDLYDRLRLIGGHDSTLCRKRMGTLLQLRGRICYCLVQHIHQMCNNAEFEYAYCKTLLESKYNTEIRHNICFSSKEVALIPHDKKVVMSLKEKELVRRVGARKIAINIRNAMRYIESTSQKCEYRKYELMHAVMDASDVLSKRMNILTWVFGVVSFLSLLVSVVSAIIDKCG